MQLQGHIAHASNLRVMGGDDDRRLVVGIQVLNQGQNPLGTLLIQGAGRFIT